ncbi:hypothetical protein DENSPDRAFT_14505 [Dentipellis sp. KUC8613]|nr:hypothetical protein DENSPDRAFT_14505 [Dentipellis sp. KUC8613]
MALSRSFRLATRNRRTITSYLFGLTFFASILTVSASDVLPCPVRPDTRRFADGEQLPGGMRRPVVVEKRPSRWIEEKPPARTA